MNKLLIIAIIIAVLALVAHAKSLVCAQCQTKQCLTVNNCHLARSGLLGSTLLEEEEEDEQKWKGWKKIGNALKDINISIALEEVEAEEQKWKGWKKIGKALKKVGNVLKDSNISVTLEEESEYGLQAGGDSIAAVAKNHLGVKYVYGGSSWSSGVDCSGFTMLVVKEATGISLPRTSDAQRGVGTTVNGVANARPGDLVFFPGHVGIYVGGNQIAHAPHTGSVTKVAPIWETPQLIKRIV